MNEFLITIMGYVVVFIISFVLFDFLLSGFLRTFLRVKASRGRLVMIQVRSTTRDYFNAGKIEEGFLVYTIGGWRDKTTKRLSVSPNNVFRALGVNWVQVDEEKNAVVNIDFSTIRGFDAAKWDNLLKRALYRPSILDQREKIIMILIIAVVFGIIGLMFYVYNIGVKIDDLTLQVEALKTIAPTVK